MLEHNRTDVLEKNDNSKTDVRVSVFIAITGVFLAMNFKFQLKVCNDYHSLMQKTMSFTDVVIVFVKRNDCRVIYRMCVKMKLYIYLEMLI